MNTKLIGSALRRTVAALAALLATTLALMLLASPARADTVMVNNTADPGNGTCGQPYSCTLREAIDSASPGDTIKFASNVTGTITLGGTELVIDKNLKIEGPGAGKLTVSGNDSSRVFYVSSRVAQATIQNLNISGGKPISAGDGGGIENWGTLALTKSTVSGNSARYGGGINNRDTLTVTNSTISNNVASLEGGGIENYDSKLTLTNSTVSGNSANRQGGGINQGTDKFNSVGATILIENTTITRNTASSGSGSGLAGSGLTDNSPEVRNSIILGNTNTDVDFMWSTNTFESNGHNLIGNGNATEAFNKPGDRTGISTPKIGTLANNGGPTKTHALLRGSPAIDRGSGCPANDRRGVRRPQDGDRNGSYKCDIGAFELEGPPPDKAKPTISRLSPRPGAKTFDRTPTIRATIKDNRTNLRKGNIKLYVDGRRKTNFRYSTGTDRLSYTIRRLAYKRHSVRIVTKDAAGNTAAKSWRFTVKKKR